MKKNILYIQGILALLILFPCIISGQTKLLSFYVKNIEQKKIMENDILYEKISLKDAFRNLP